MRNIEILRPISIFDTQGNLQTAGFARKGLFTYNRENLKVNRLKMKEWDYYLVMNHEIGVAFTLSDLGYIRMASVSFLNFETHEETTRTVLKAPSISYKMPVSPRQGVCEFKSNDLLLRFESAPNGRHVYCEFKNFVGRSDFKADLWFTDLPKESMNILTPFEDGKHFYLNQKMNAMPCAGKVIFNWHIYRFNPKKDLGVLDWGRGYWPYETTWYWATASAYLNEKPFGINLGYGFGDTSKASENVIFYDGKIHKLDDINFLIPEDPMMPWTITSSDGRFEAIFQPDLDRAALIKAGPVSSDQHQYFGILNGSCVLDDGTVLVIEQLRTAIEKIHNRY
ncbi:DUF2804 domain-containing protein [Ileibacterium valens]|uniref:DUF2804 domain-containing protein n=1 Tax=Ileibacterium valens TaxID=1862668 RepID=UPI002729FE2A|nr:DUF2804 domain-containing protein [Ileibacterium valens]